MFLQDVSKTVLSVVYTYIYISLKSNFMALQRYKETAQKKCECANLHCRPKWKPNEHKAHFKFIGGAKADQRNI